MKLYTGIDIIEVERIKNAIEQNNGFRERVFTEAEILFCESSGFHKYESYAARFAAKEAAAKAFGCGIGPQFSFRDCEILKDSAGKPILHFTGKARSLADRLKIYTMDVSLTHIKEMAAATVTMMGESETDAEGKTESESQKMRE